MKTFDVIKFWSKATPCLCKGTNLFYIKVNTPDHNKAGQFEKNWSTWTTANGLINTTSCV